MTKQHHQPQPNPLAALANIAAWILVLSVAGGLIYLMWPQVVAQYRAAPVVTAPAAPTMTTQQRVDRLYAAPTAQPPSAPTPVPAPVVAAEPAPAQPDAPPVANPQVVQAIQEKAPIIIIPRNGSTTTIGGGACAVARGARRCGK